VLDGASVAILSDPSVEGNEPDFLQKHLDVTSRIVIDHLRNVFNADSFFTLAATFSFTLSKISND